MRIETGLRRYITQLEADGRSRHTIKQYERHVRLFAQWCAEVGHSRDLDALRHEDLAAFLASDTARLRPDGTPKKATALNCLRSSLRTFFAHLHRAGYLRADPARLVRLARCGGPPPRGLSEKEARTLLAAMAEDRSAAGKRDHALFRLMLETGVRLGSALALRTTDIDLAQRELLLRETKGDRPVRVCMSRGVTSHLRRYLRSLDGEVLFPGQGGRPLGQRQAARRLALWAEEAGIRGSVHPHMMRHTFAMLLYAKTRDVLLVKEALRHRSIASTLVYCHADRERLREVL